MDDILREHIGIRCYVYIDDIVIFGENEEKHFENLEKVFTTFESANLKVQLDKSEFLKEEIEFLGFMVSTNGIKPNLKKIQSILEFPPPQTLKDLRSALGMFGYYRRFVKDFAALAKPLTALLRGEDGRVSKNLSKNKRIKLGPEEMTAFNNLKTALTSKEVVLSYPDFDMISSI